MSLLESAKLRALRAHVSKCLACLCAQVPCVLTCSFALRVLVLTCLRALHAYVPACLAYLCANVPYVLTCSHANMSWVLMCSRAYMPCLLYMPTGLRALKLHDKDKFSITCFPYIFVIVLCFFPMK